MSQSPSFFQRFLLPGFAFKAVIIGGGYATGRELVEFFFPAGPAGGMLGMLMVMLIWSAACTVTFLFALATHSYDYKTFFKNLLGRYWVVFEICYILFIFLVLSVFGAAAGEIGRAVFGFPTIMGTLMLAGGIVLFTTLGNHAVEQLFKYVTIFLYTTYFIFFVLSFNSFGDRIADRLFIEPVTANWPRGGLIYAGYSLVGAVVILPMIRHLTSSKDAVIAGMLCGPFAILPAILFFICVVGFYPEIWNETLPSDFLLRQLELPVFHVIYQLMIFAALLESGTGLVHAINERVATVFQARQKRLTEPMRLGVAVTFVVIAIFVAERVGLVTLIAKGYGSSAYIFLAIYALPLFTIGVWCLVKIRRATRNDTIAPSNFAE
ncbi:MAG: YkvI family membrane protein [Luteimonas sp.]